MQRKVNRSDSDYHYGKEKYKRNVYKMMLECKNEEFKSGDKSDYFKVFREGANKRGNSSRLTQSFHFFMFEPIFSPVNALNQPI